MPQQPGVPRRSPFLGPAYSARSPVLALDQCINLYPEIVERETPRGTTKEVGAFYGCPGLTAPAITLGSGPIRGMLGLGLFLYVVSGAALYRLASGFTSTFLGTLGTSSGLVQMTSNASQIGVIDGTGNIYVWNAFTSTFSTVALPGGATFTPTSTTTLNGFTLVNEQLTQTMWQSNLGDMTTWNALNFANADATSDFVIGFGSLHNQVYVFKQNHIEVWPNAGQQGFTFQRLPGVLPEIGATFATTIVKVADSLIWLGSDPNGTGKIYRIKGYDPARVSNYALEQVLTTYNFSSAFAFGYSQAGHDFYVITFPLNGVTWCLDVTASEQMGMPMWHQRASWNGSAFGMFAPSSAALFNQQIVAGDYVNGNIYALDLNTYTDNGQPRRWLRTWRERPDFDLASSKVNCLEIEYQSGVGVPGGVTPNFNLRQSFDGGWNWSASRTAAAGQANQTGVRARFNRLGMVRRGAESDRIFELSSTDQMAVALLGAWVS